MLLSSLVGLILSASWSSNKPYRCTCMCFCQHSTILQSCVKQISGKIRGLLNNRKQISLQNAAKKAGEERRFLTINK